MRRLLLIVSVLMVLLTGCGAAADGAGLAAVQNDDGAPIRLAPPSESQHAEAELVVLIDEGGFDARWNDLRSIGLGLGGQVTSATTGITEYRSERYEFGTIHMTVPTHRFDEALDRIEALGEPVSSTYRIVTDRVDTDSTIVATITESPGVIAASPAPEGRIDRALATAGDILLTALSIVIVAGAVLIPVGLVALLGLVIWRRLAPARPPVPDGEERHEAPAEATL